jgi:hypothetical protein
MARRILFCLLALVSASCVERSRSLTTSEREQLRPYISRTAPRPQHRLRAKLGDSVELVGYDLSEERWMKGTKLVVTWYWHALADVDSGYMLFTHLAAPNGQNHAGADGEGIVRRLYPPGRWNAGEYIRDVQEITLAADFPDPNAVLFVGVWKGTERLPVRYGPTDGANRVRAATIPVVGGSVTRTAADLPTLRVPRALGAITLDGKLDEDSWQAAPLTTPFVRTGDGDPSDFGATARAVWDDRNLYVAFDVADSYLESRFTRLDEHLWEKDCVEIMLDPGGDSRNYFEVQASPMGVVFDTRYDMPRDPQPFGHVDWNSGMRVGVTRRGTPNDDEADDQGYTVEIALPLRAFEAGMPPTPLPTAGTEWRVNFYVMDTQPNGQRANGWSPPRVGDFHMPQRFGRIVFEGPR